MEVHVHNPSTTGISITGVDSALLDRIRDEFYELPAMHVTFEQAVRLWSVDPHVCRAALDRLVQAGFLIRDVSGRYQRAHGGY